MLDTLRFSVYVFKKYYATVTKHAENEPKRRLTGGISPVKADLFGGLCLSSVSNLSL